MNKSFFDALALLGDENSVDTEVLVEKVKSAMLKAARKAYTHSEENFKIDIDPAKKKFDMYIIQQVIDDEPIDINEINIDEARAKDPNAYVGGTILHKVDISKFGRAAALSAKQSIKGDLREINREQFMRVQSFIFSEMSRFPERFLKRASLSRFTLQALLIRRRNLLSRFHVHIRTLSSVFLSLKCLKYMTVRLR